MNDAIFAIPGLMPPSAPNFHSKLIAPEDGSLCMCVHCGPSGDNVTYAVVTPGWFGGVIKDPSYNYGPMPLHVAERLRKHLDRMPQFLTISEVLPPDAIVPRVRFRGCPVPLTERTDLLRPLYWILRLPIRSLPPGDTVVQVVVNGRLHKHIVQRPRFAIHSWRDITPRFACENHQLGEAFDIAIKEGQPRDIVINLSDMFEQPGLLAGAEYRAECIIDGNVVKLMGEGQGDRAIIHVPPMPAGMGLWRAQYKLFDDWLDLTAGDIVVVPDKDKAAHSLELYVGESGSFDVSLDSCVITPAILEGAEYKAEVLVNGTSEDCPVVRNDDNTLTVYVPALEAGEGLWTVQYKVLEEWLDLSVGTIKIIQR